MAATRAILALVLSAFFTFGSAQIVCAQIINASAPKNQGSGSRAAEDFNNAKPSEGVQQVGWPSIPLPKITMPKITMPKLPPLWPSGADDQSPALLSPFVAGFSKISAGTKRAWEGTKELFSVGRGRNVPKPAPRRTPQPSFWERLVGRPPEPAAPQTIGGFMSQKRLDP